MSIRTRIARWLLGDQAPKTIRPFARGFDAAKVDDLSFGFGSASANMSMDLETINALERIRGRARNLAHNNDYARRFLRLAVNNIVGPSGFKLQVQAMEGATPDQLANRLIEASFAEWAKRGSCDVTGTLSFVDLCRLAVEAWKRDGEVLIRRVRGRAAGNRWNYALQILDIDRLPVQYQGENGRNVIVMGVEIDPAGRPVAYHLAPFHPGQTTGWTSAPTARADRVDARDVFHLYRAQRPEQRRGIPEMHTAMMRIEQLGKFEQAAVIAARKGAETLGFFVTPDGQSPIVDAVGTDGNPIATSVPGSFDTLPQGVEFKEFATQYPTDVFGHFLKWNVRGIASGLGISYNSLANDLENVNYSSIRAGLLEERDGWMSDQDWFIEAFLTPVYLDWLEMALLSGAITFPGGNALPAVKVDKFAVHSWQGRRWAWVDPLKDIEAQVAAVRANLKSRRQVIAEMGGDIEDVWAQLKAEQDEAAAMDLDLGDTTPTPINAATEPAPAEN